MPILAAAGYAVLAPNMRGYGDSDKPAGTAGYEGRALAAEFRALVHLLGFGAGSARTPKEDTTKRPAASLRAQQSRFDNFATSSTTSARMRA
jgi:hypothetical protein